MLLRSLKQEHPAFAMPTSFQPPANWGCRPILPVYAAILSVYGRNEPVAEPREQKSALLTRMVLSVEAGIEIDFRMVDSLLALERNLQAEEFILVFHQSRLASALSRCLCQAAPGLPGSSVGRRPIALASSA